MGALVIIAVAITALVVIVTRIPSVSSHTFGGEQRNPTEQELDGSVPILADSLFGQEVHSWNFLAEYREDSVNKLTPFLAPKGCFYDPEESETVLLEFLGPAYTAQEQKERSPFHNDLGDIVHWRAQTMLALVCEDPEQGGGLGGCL